MESGAKRAAVLVTDVPAASGPVKTLGTVFYKNAGATLDVVTIPLGTADMTPQVQSELSKNPDQFALVGDSAFCNSAVKAIRTLGFSKPIIGIPQCLPFTQTIPGGLTGVKILTAASTDPSDSEVKLYDAVMATYAPGTNAAGDVTSGGYAAVLGFARAMTGLSGDLTAANINSALASMSPQPLPLASGVTFQCNGKALSFFPGICSTGALQTDLSQDGKPTTYKPFDAADVSKLG